MPSIMALPSVIAQELLSELTYLLTPVPNALHDAIPQLSFMCIILQADIPRHSKELELISAELHEDTRTTSCSTGPVQCMAHGSPSSGGSRRKDDAG